MAGNSHAVVAIVVAVKVLNFIVSVFIDVKLVAWGALNIIYSRIFTIIRPGTE